MNVVLQHVNWASLSKSWAPMLKPLAYFGPFGGSFWAISLNFVKKLNRFDVSTQVGTDEMVEMEEMVQKGTEGNQAKWDLKDLQE